MFTNKILLTQTLEILLPHMISSLWRQISSGLQQKFKIILEKNLLLWQLKPPMSSLNYLEAAQTATRKFKLPIGQFQLFDIKLMSNVVFFHEKFKFFSFRPFCEISMGSLNCRRWQFVEITAHEFLPITCSDIVFRPFQNFQND